MAKVYVGMSGGVDSSVAASLLVEQGYDVTGVYMKNWSQDLPGMKCPWAEDLADAKRVAVGLGIDFKVFDFEKEYKQRVVDYMLDEYKKGRTPNPDIMCNQEVKFKLFLDTALADGADMIATGHYARVVRNDDVSSGPNSAVASRQGDSSLSSLRSAELASAQTSSTGQENDNKLSGISKRPTTPDHHVAARLLQAVDTNKDQTYFLYRVSQKALEKTLFPLGDYTKPQVREMAQERGLWTASKKESMGVCFVGAVGIRDFIGHYVETEVGDIVDQTTGEVVGRHDGAIFYTIGQRHGLDIGGGLPYYVVAKNMAKNAVYVSKNLNNEVMWRDSIELEQLHWIGHVPTADDELTVRLRHRGALLPCRLSGSVLTLEQTERAVAAGQSAVIYSGEDCLGGGIVS